MLNITLDPSFFWLSQKGVVDVEALSEAVSATLAWLSAPKSSEYTLRVNSKDIDHLATMDLYPTELHYTDILKSAGLDHVVTPQELSSIVSIFLSKTDLFDDQSRISELVCSSITLTEDITSVILDPSLRSLSIDSASVVAANNVACSHEIWAFAPPAGQPLAINVNAHIEIVGQQKFAALEGTKIFETVGVIRSPTEVLEAISAEKLWISAKDDHDIKLSIIVDAYKNLGCARDNLVKFSIGHNFKESLVQNMAAGASEYASVVRRKCAQIVSRQNNIDISDFYNTANKSSGVRRRSFDQARAKRCHITRSGRALRLMIWEKCDGSMELANIGNKWNEEILE